MCLPIEGEIVDALAFNRKVSNLGAGEGSEQVDGRQGAEVSVGQIYVEGGVFGLVRDQYQ